MSQYRLPLHSDPIPLGSQKNVLLVKDKLGRGRASTRDLPKESFAFGKPDLMENRETVSKGKCVSRINALKSCYELELPPAFERQAQGPTRLQETEQDVAEGRCGHRDGPIQIQVVE